MGWNVAMSIALKGLGEEERNMSTAKTDELITARQYAEEMGVTLRHVYQMRYLGFGPVSFKRGGRIVFRRSDIDAYLERQRVRTLRGEGVPSDAHANASG